MTAWEKVQIARSPDRKTSLDYIEEIFDDFFELHGDRNYGDDKSTVRRFSKDKQSKLYSNCSAEGKNYERKYRKKFWNAKARRI